MDKQKLARLSAIVSITLLGAIAIVMTPFLFGGDNTTAHTLKLLALLLGIGLVIEVISYVTLKLLHKSDQKNASEESQ
ncbi:hypothetical protein ACUIAC_04685 [Dermabacteraceae bacterium P13138]